MQTKNFKVKYVICALAIAVAALGFSACKKQTPEEIEAEICQKVENVAKKANEYAAQGKYSSAIECIDSCIKKYGERAELCLAMACVYEKLNNAELAGVYFLKAAEASKNAEYFKKAGLYFSKANSFDSAIDAYKKYLQLVPNDVVEWKNLAACYEHEGNLKEAVSAYTSGMKASPTTISIADALKLGELYSKLGENQKARGCFEGARKYIAHANAEQKIAILSNLVVIYSKSDEDMPKLVEAFDELKALKSDVAMPEIEAKVTSYKNQKRLEEEAKKIAEAEKARLEKERLAKEEAEKKAKLDAEAKAKALVEKQKAEEEAKRLASEKAKLAEEALSQDEKDEKLVNKHLAENNLADAERVSQNMVARDQKSLLAWKTLAKVYSLEGKDKDAYIASKECVRIAPSDVNCELLMLEKSEKVLDSESLLDAFYAAREKYPTNAEIVLKLARIYSNQKNLVEARHNYKLFFRYADDSHPLFNAAKSEFENIEEDSEK